MNITLDDKTTTVTTRLNTGSPTTRQALPWSAADLDPHLQHKLVVTMVDGNIIDVDRVDITLLDSDNDPESPTTPESGTEEDEDAAHGTKARTWLMYAPYSRWLCYVAYLQ